MGIFQKAVGYFTKKATVPLEEYFCKLQVDFVYRKFAIETCIDLIANAMSKAEFKSYEDGKNKKNDLYYRLNVAPNKKNNATEFRKKLIRRLIFYNEVLIVSPSNNSSEIFIADSWDITEYALKDDVFSQVQINNIVLDREFLESDVIYIKYADQQIRQLVDAYYQAYGKLISSAMNVYKRSNARRYVLKGNLFRPQDNTTQDQINKMMTSQFKPFMEADNAGAVFQLQEGFNLEDFSGNFQSNSRDIKNLIDDIFEMTAAAFHVPKNLLKGDMSGLSDQVDAFLMFEIIPIAELIQDAFNASLYEAEEYLSGNFVRVDTTMIKITSFKDLVDAIDVGIRNGVFTINEGRERVGNDRSDKAMADEIFITKNNQQVSKGGEANDDNENISSSEE
ncbi:phage portal protein [Enterococcus faecium]|uniref:phage portal protein n=1 Tax=Enterococcus faecium TaxID=1352 RepID=UPI00032D68EB|nr:phage portal protein [Enterococcus faecium]EGP4910726.1 phage portal protein [Enterococcus faecium]EOG05358.1 HK97 family phage portal protein [Enterococcus faecium EnGen0175]EOG07661.1 HK97 family phage portal protein [Enterococcus faecium EnGen0175]